MNPPDACPDPARLHALLGGELDEAGEALGSSSHLDGAPPAGHCSTAGRPRSTRSRA